MLCAHRGDTERLLRTCHCNVVQTARGVRVFVAADSVPSAIEQRDMVELQTLRPVSS